MIPVFGIVPSSRLLHQSEVLHERDYFGTKGESFVSRAILITLSYLAREIKAASNHLRGRSPMICNRKLSRRRQFEPSAKLVARSMLAI